MINRSILYFSWFASLFFLVVNVILILTAYVDKALYDLEKWNQKRRRTVLEPLLIGWLRGEKSRLELEKRLRIRRDRQLFFQCLASHEDLITEEKRRELADFALVKRFLKSAEREPSLDAVKEMGVLQNMAAYPYLLTLSASEDFEMRYSAFLALSRLPLGKKEKSDYLNRLFSWEFSRDRTIEMIQELSLSPEETLDEVIDREDPIVKSALLRSLEGRIKAPLSDDFYFRLLKGLEGSKEVRIATVVLLASAGESRCLEALISMYPREEAWEVRAAMARAVDRFSIDERSVAFLKAMVYDSHWWVRNNAANALAKAGAAGLDALVDVTLDQRNKEASDLAYALLNADPGAHQTLKELSQK